MSAVGSVTRSLAPELVGLTIVGVLLAVAAHTFSCVRVEGASMRPALEVGDIVVVDKHAAPIAGDIVLFRLEGDSTPTLHRAVEATAGSMLTRGDANPTRDRRSVPMDRVLGRVRWVVPFGLLAKRLAG